MDSETFFVDLMFGSEVVLEDRGLSVVLKRPSVDREVQLDTPDQGGDESIEYVRILIGLINSALNDRKLKLVKVVTDQEEILEDPKGLDWSKIHDLFDRDEPPGFIEKYTFTTIRAD